MCAVARLHFLFFLVVHGTTKRAIGLIIHDDDFLLGEWLAAAGAVCFLHLFQHVMTASVTLDVATW